MAALTVRYEGLFCFHFVHVFRDRLIEKGSSSYGEADFGNPRHPINDRHMSPMKSSLIAPISVYTTISRKLPSGIFSSLTRLRPPMAPRLDWFAE